MDLKEQKYVCTLAECKSLTRASERLYISQPALSLYINNVEKILGARLFERNGRKFELTWLGKQYVEKASQMLELERQFEAVRRQAERENAGQVRIGIAQRRGIWFLPAVLSVYEREWPQVDVVIREGNLADLTIMLKNRELDLVVLSRSDVTSEMEAVPLGMEDFLLILPGDHPLNEKAVPVEGSMFDFLDPHLLSGETIFLNTEMQSARRVEEKILKDHKVKPGRIRVVRNMELGAQLVAEGGLYPAGLSEEHPLSEAGEILHHRHFQVRTGCCGGLPPGCGADQTHASDDHADEGCSRGVFEALIN